MLIAHEKTCREVGCCADLQEISREEEEGRRAGVGGRRVTPGGSLLVIGQRQEAKA